jgi:hypothetical protein
MALTKRSESKTIYLEVKHYCLWRALKKEVPGCDVVEANNPATGGKVVKYGYRFDTVTGNATRLTWYDTERKYSKRYFGFKLSLIDGAETFVLDMPYTSQVLRRFLHVAPNVDWTVPLSITVFKGKRKEGAREGAEPTGIWFHQLGETVKAYYTREEPHGMPEATFDDALQQWDFRAQMRWLATQLKERTIPDIEAAATRAPEADSAAEFEGDGVSSPDVGGDWQADDSDCPF